MRKQKQPSVGRDSATRKGAMAVVGATVTSFPFLAFAQISLTTTYSQNFDTLASSGTSSTVPSGWAFVETGSNANTTYGSGAGGSNVGDTYSFGAASSSERAFGSLRSGSVISTIGARFKNDTVASLQGFSLAYIGEQWRLGATGRLDKLIFEVSTEATSVDDGTAAWWAATALDFTAPITTGTVGALDGNASSNRTSIKKNFTFDTAVASGSEFWIRWQDLNATGSDDGLAVDDLTINTSRDLTWDGNAGTTPNPSNNDGVWSDASKWHDGTTNVTWANAPGDNAIFGTGAGAGANSVTLNSNQTAGTISFAASSPTYTLSGAGSLTIKGAAGISAAQSANISVGVILGADQTWTVASAQTLTLSGGITGTGKALTVSGAGTTTIVGLNTSTGGSLTKSGSGVLVLSGTSNYTGTTKITAGTLDIASTSALPSTSVLTFANPSSGTIALTASGTYTSGGIATAAGFYGGSNSATNLTLGSATTLDLNGDLSYAISASLPFPLTVSGGTLNLGATQRNFDVVSNSNGTYGDVKITSQIAGTAGISKAGLGTLALGGINSLSGPIDITAGVLRVDVAGALNSQNALTITGSASLNLNGTSQTVGSAAGAGAVVTSTASGILTFGDDNTNTSFTGQVTGPGAFVKAGTGSVSLGGTARPFTGQPTIGNGTISVTLLADSGVSSAIGASAEGSPVILGTSTTAGALSYQGSAASVTRTFALANAGGVFDIPASSNNLTLSGVLSNAPSSSGKLIKTGAGALILNAPANHTGNTLIQNGTLSLTDSASIAGSPKIILSGSGVLDVSAVTSGFSLAASQTLAGSGSVYGPVTVGAGVISPGASAGSLSFDSDVTTGATSTLEIEAGGAIAGVNFDLVTVSGAGMVLTIDNTILVVHPTPTAQTDVAYRVVEATDGAAIEVTNFFAGLVDGQEYVASPVYKYKVNAYSDHIDITFTAIPEPASLSFFGLGAGFMGRRRRKIL